MPGFYPGNREIMPGIMGYGNPPGNGWSPFSTDGIYYQLQPKYNRQVRERFGAQNVGSGRFHPVPHTQPHYWNDYTTTFRDYYDGNHYWQHFEVPASTTVRVLDRNDVPVNNASIALYQVGPADVRHTWSYGGIINNSTQLDGQFYIPVSGNYAFSSLSLGNVKIMVDGENLVRTSDVQTYNQTSMTWTPGGGRTDVFRPSKSPSSFIEPGRIFRHGIFRNFKTLDTGWYTILIEYDTHDPGGNPFAIMYECVSSAGVPWQSIPDDRLRWPADSGSAGGIRKREFSGQPDTSAVPIDSLPLRSSATNMPLAYTSSGGFMIDNTIDAMGSTDFNGEWQVPIRPLGSDPDLSKRPGLSIFRVQYTNVYNEMFEVFLPLDITDLTMYYWLNPRTTGVFTLSRSMEGYDADLPPVLPEAVSGLLLLAIAGFSSLRRRPYTVSR
jgi:hypothetical protein